jgi:hypothetical protein
VAFVVITMLGYADGNPEKLYKPRDFQGAYCGVPENWNNGPNTENMEYQSYTMNVSATVGTIAKQLMCSTAVKNVLTSTPGLLTLPEQSAYLCDCCLIPCGTCQGAEDHGGDLITQADLVSTMSNKLADLTSPSNAGNLFSPSGANGATFSATAIWSEATKYMLKVCLPDCNTNVDTIKGLNNQSEVRQYHWQPSMDDPLYFEWQTINNSASNDPAVAAIRATLQGTFTFMALPFSVCPYNEAFCVPFPGVSFSQLSTSNYCTIEMAAEVVDALGSSAAQALQGLGMSDFADVSPDSFGDWVGDFQLILDSFVVTVVLSFVIGILFLVLLRWFLGICIWLAILVTLCIIILAGGVAMVKSYQCAGAGLLETGTQSAVAVTAVASSEVGAAIGTQAKADESMTGDGGDYRGAQTMSKNGHACQNWNTQARMPNYHSSNYPDSGLADASGVGNTFCRNPYKQSDTYKATTIWCITSDPTVYWEECLPIGVIKPECELGYAVSSESARQGLYYLSLIIWAIGLIYLFLIICFAGRIKLAIALNKVAAFFLSQNPSTLLVPLVQALVGILWVLVWCMSASFLISQVPENWVPTQGYQNYSDAYGTASSCAFWEELTSASCAGTPGQCNGKWPTGFVWKDVDCGDNPAEPMCYKCAPPRYVLDWKFAVSFFVFLWNCAFNIALGQLIIAMVVCVWFFTESSRKWKTIVVPKAVKDACRYHLGSVMLGSFIIAVIQFIRYVMKYFEKQAAAQKNRILVLILKCVQCCIWCFEKCVKFLNKNAYIQIALKGKGFCASAKAAFSVITRNMLRFGTVAALGVFVHAIGFFFIMTCTVIAGYFVLQAMHEDVAPIMPCLTFIFVGYIVAKLFMNVFGLAVDTSLQCFIETEEMGGDNEFVPACLKSFVKDQDEKPDPAAKDGMFKPAPQPSAGNKSVVPVAP